VHETACQREIDTTAVSNSGMVTSWPQPFRSNSPGSGNSLGVRLPAGEIRRLNLARVGSELARDIHL